MNPELRENHPDLDELQEAYGVSLDSKSSKEQLPVVPSEEGTAALLATVPTRWARADHTSSSISRRELLGTETAAAGVAAARKNGASSSFNEDEVRQLALFDTVFDVVVASQLHDKTILDKVDAALVTRVAGEIEAEHVIKVDPDNPKHIALVANRVLDCLFPLPEGLKPAKDGPSCSFRLPPKDGGGRTKRSEFQLTDLKAIAKDLRRNGNGHFTSIREGVSTVAEAMAPSPDPETLFLSQTNVAWAKDILHHRQIPKVTQEDLTQAISRLGSRLPEGQRSPTDLLRRLGWELGGISAWTAREQLKKFYGPEKEATQILKDLGFPVQTESLPKAGSKSKRSKIGSYEEAQVRDTLTKIMAARDNQPFTTTREGLQYLGRALGISEHGLNTLRRRHGLEPWHKMIPTLKPWTSREAMRNISKEEVLEAWQALMQERNHQPFLTVVEGVTALAKALDTSCFVLYDRRKAWGVKTWAEFVPTVQQISQERLDEAVARLKGKLTSAASRPRILIQRLGQELDGACTQAVIKALKQAYGTDKSTAAIFTELGLPVTSKRSAPETKRRRGNSRSESPLVRQGPVVSALEKIDPEHFSTQWQKLMESRGHQPFRTVVEGIEAIAKRLNVCRATLYNRRRELGIDSWAEFIPTE